MVNTELDCCAETRYLAGIMESAPANTQTARISQLRREKGVVDIVGSFLMSGRIIPRKRSRFKSEGDVIQTGVRWAFQVYSSQREGRRAFPVARALPPTRAFSAAHGGAMRDLQAFDLAAA